MNQRIARRPRPSRLRETVDALSGAREQALSKKVSTQIIVVPNWVNRSSKRASRAWLKKEGEAVAAGEPLVELETEKIDLEVSAEQAGVLAKHRPHRKATTSRSARCWAVVEAGDGAAAGAPAGAGPERRPQPRACAGPAGRDPSAPRRPRAAWRETHEDRPSSNVAGPRRRRPHHQGRRRWSKAPPDAPPAAASSAPAAAAVAREAASRRNRTRRRQPPRAAGARAEERVRMSKRRATIASASSRRSTRRDADDLQRGRHDGGDGAARAPEGGVQGAHGVGLGIASFFVKASVARCARSALNAEIQGDEMVLKHYYDIGIAVGAAAGAGRAGAARRRRDVVRADRAGRSATSRQARQRRHAVARGSQGRHVHDHQRRRLRIAPEHADPQPAAGRHPRPAQDRGAADRRRRTGRAAR